MNTNKYFVQQIALNVFRLTLYGLVTVFALCFVFTTSKNIEKAFVTTKAYQKFIPISIEAAVKLNQNSNQAPIKDPAVQQIIKDSFPAEKLQAETEEIIHSTYAWLYGEKAKPEFVADFSENINLFADKLSAYGMTRLRSLPICEVSPQTVDPYTASCRPRFFDYTAEQKILADTIRQNNGLVEKTVFTVSDLPKTATGKTLIDQYSYAPLVFKIIRYTPYVLSALLMISIVIVIWLDRNKRDAWYKVGKSMVGATIFLIVSPLVYFYILPYFFPALSIRSSSGSGGAVFSNVVNRLTVNFSNQLIIVSSTILILGMFIIFAERLTRPKSKYTRVDKRAGLLSSEAPRKKQNKIKSNASKIPIQTSEGEKQSSKFQKDKRYRRINKKDL
ncbi:MAG: hypothetical protein WCP03_02905 [Candidatus Saccharibacteria bacterium]